MERLAGALGVDPVTPEERDLLLACAREVAHGTERRNAPLSTFLLGLAVGSGDVDRAAVLPDAVRRVLAVVRTEGGPQDPPVS